jgi:hypothetical protein
MRFLVIVKANKDSEAGKMPTQEMLTDMGKFNEELANAGIMLAGEGLHPSSNAKRIKFSKAKRKVSDGPFGRPSRPNELIAGYWLWKCDSWEQAVDWAKRIPFQEGEVEIRQVFEAEDFGAEFTPELRAQEERLRARAEQTATETH